jgi:hypothetical protein
MPGMEPDTCAKNIAKELEKINDSQEEQERITKYTQDKKIKDLVHFTRVENLKGILKYGLIPRYYLEKKAFRVQVPLRPELFDNQNKKVDKKANNLSISVPDYEMFSKLSKDDDDNWVMILFDLEPLKKHKCDYNPGDNLKLINGSQGLEKMFSDSEKREKWQLDSWLTTNPRATVLDYSKIPQSCIKKILLPTNKHLRKVTDWDCGQKIKVEVNEKLFKDYNYRQSSEPYEGTIIPIDKNAFWETMKSAIRDSRKSLFITSGWISSVVIQKKMLELLKAAIQRGVKIYLAYGFVDHRLSEHKESEPAKTALRKLKELSKETSKAEGELNVVKFDNHTKIIIVDADYIIHSSKNWLSTKMYSKNDEWGTKIISKELAEKTKKEYEEKFSKLKNILDSPTIQKGQ